MDEALPLTTALPADRADEAFDRFFDANRVRLHAALWLITRDAHESEEIAQDAFVKVFERWERVRRLEDPVGYLFRTAMNVHRNRIRRAGVAIRRLMKPSPERDRIAAVDERDAVVRALATLTPRQRAAIVLTDLLEMTSEEAARALGVRAPTVRVLAARARSALRETLGDDDA
jgi:RNA polymerase sigma factor (sigma-70 family)